MGKGRNKTPLLWKTSEHKGLLLPHLQLPHQEHKSPVLTFHMDPAAQHQVHTLPPTQRAAFRQHYEEIVVGLLEAEGLLLGLLPEVWASRSRSLLLSGRQEPVRMQVQRKGGLLVEQWVFYA
jgi:hypothetical protein